jgi:putative ABC transport system permease protein
VSGWLTPLRMSWREARRARVRSLLVIAMIALPVAGLGFGAITADMFRVSAADELTRQIGSADARLTWVSPEPIRQDPNGYQGMPGAMALPGWTPPGAAELLAELPPGSRLVPDLLAGVTVELPDGVAGARAVITDAGDPLLAGRVKLLRGKAPAHGSEVALTELAARWLGLEPGDTLTTLGPRQDLRVTGIIEFPGNLSRLIVFHPAAAVTPDPGGNYLASVSAPVDARMIARLNEKGILVASPAALTAQGIPGLGLPTGPDEIVIGLVFICLAVVEIVLMTGPAFAIGARRRARDLALVAACGGEPKQLRRVILADGVVLGLAGAVSGIVLAIAAAAATRPLLETMNGFRAGGWHFAPLPLLAIAAIAVGTGLLAAMIPAFAASRQNVLAVLNGRRGASRSRRRWIAAGVVMSGLGAPLAVAGATAVNAGMLVTGLILLELGLVLLTPALIGLIARAGRWLPLTPRLALRDLARNRSSAAPAVSAVMAAVAGAAGAGMFFWSMDHQQAQGYHPEAPMGHVTVIRWDPAQPAGQVWAQAETMVRQAYPDSQVAQLRQILCADGSDRCEVHAVVPEPLRCPYPESHLTSSGYAYRELTEADRRAASKDARCRDQDQAWKNFFGTLVDDGSGLVPLTGLTGETLDRARAVLAAGGAIVADPARVDGGKVTLSTWDSQSWQVPGMAIEGLPTLAGTIVSPAALAHHPSRLGVFGLIVKPAAPSSEAAEEHLRSLLHQLPGSESGSWTDVYAERGNVHSNRRNGLLFTAAAALIALIAAGVAIGLTAAESRADLITLAIVGAQPAIRRRFSLGSAGVIAGLGTILGAVTGAAIAGVILILLNRFEAQARIWPIPAPMRLGIGWETLALVLAVPLVAMLGAALFTRTRLPIERRL